MIIKLYATRTLVKLAAVQGLQAVLAAKTQKAVVHKI